MTPKDIAKAMGTTVSHIKAVMKNKEPLTPTNVNTYISSIDLHFWEFVLEAIPIKHLPGKVKKKVLLCKQISDYIKKK